ncbi:Hypothetical protein GLP15_275 [Giardia lamblia P15]|uniref:Uncharacterized protein n=1 Tax=Giardia intestinalis (strain P15) TaxID=658858 RepID=E1F5W2_GIAIA|nr:Hypothetical protein GLP15_275 [Giardia lamblia P15]
MSLKRSTTPLRVPQILGGPPQKTERDTAMGSGIIRAKNGDQAKAGTTILPVSSCYNEVVHLIEILATQCAKDFCDKISTRINFNGLQFYCVPMQLGCPGYMLVRPGYYKWCQIYHVDFLYRRAVLFMKREVVVAPLALVRVNSYASLNSIFGSILYEEIKAVMTSSELDVYASNLDADSPSKPVMIPWRDRYLLPATFNDHLFKQNPVLKHGVCPNEHLIAVIKILVKREWERFIVTYSSRKGFVQRVDANAVEYLFIDELRFSITGLANLQGDHFSLTNSYLLDLMVPSIYMSTSLPTCAPPEVSEEGSEMVVKYDLEDAELHGLSSLYKFVIAKSIIEEALGTNRLDARHKFDHLRFYFRLSLKHVEGACLFADPFHATLHGVELFCLPPCSAPRFQDAHDRLLSCSKFDPSLLEFRNKIFRVIDYVLHLLIPFPDDTHEVEEDSLVEIPRLIALSLATEFSIDEELCTTISDDLQTLLNKRVTTFLNNTSSSSLQTKDIDPLNSNLSTTDQKPGLVVSESLELFLRRHLPVLYETEARSEEHESPLVEPFSPLLPISSIAERYYLARLYFIEKIIPLILSSVIAALLQSGLLNHVANSIVPTCVSDSTFFADFSAKVKQLRVKSVKEASEKKSDRRDRLLASGLPLSVIYTALSILADENQDLSSDAVLTKAFDRTWPRFLRALAEQIKAHIGNIFLQMHEMWSRSFLDSLLPVIDSSRLRSRTDSSTYIPLTSSASITKNQSIGFTHQSTPVTSFTWLQQGLRELSFYLYTTQFSISSIGSLVLAPRLSFDPTSIDRTAIVYSRPLRGLLDKRMRSLLFLDKYSFEVPTVKHICKALLPNVKQIAQATSDELAFALTQDLLLSNPDQEVDQFFSSWLGSKQRQPNVLVPLEPMIYPKMHLQLPPLCPASRTEKPQRSSSTATTHFSNIENGSIHVKGAVDSPPVLIASIAPSSTDVAMRKQIDSLFEALSMKLVELLSLCNNIGDFYRAFELVAGGGLMQGGLSDTSFNADDITSAYSAPPECLLKIQTPSEILGDEAQSFDTSQVLNPYTSIGEDSTKVSPEYVRSLSTIEAIAKDYVSMVLKGESSKQTIIALASSSGLDHLVLTVHASAELVRAIDQAVLNAYAIPSYASAGIITISLIDFKLSLVSAFIMIRQNITESISKSITQASSYMLRVMQVTESVLNITTLNLDKLSQILVVMEDHGLFVRQWTPVACYLCDFLDPISKLGNSYCPSTLCNIRHSITHEIPVVSGLSGSSDQSTTALNPQLTLDQAQAPHLIETSILSSNALHVALQAATQLGWVNHAYKTARFNYKRHIRVFSRVLLVFSDWLSKVTGVLYAISSEVLKVQLSDFQLAVTNPLQFRKMFPTFSKNIEIPYLEAMYSNFEGNDLLLVSEVIKTLQAYTCIHISINSEVVNGFSALNTRIAPQGNRSVVTDKHTRHPSSLEPECEALESPRQLNDHHAGWQLPYQGYRWPYLYSRPCLDSVSKQSTKESITQDSLSPLDYLLVTDCNFEFSERSDLFVSRSNQGLIVASTYLHGHLCDNKQLDIPVDHPSLTHYDVFRMFMELYILIEEIKNIYLRVSSWSRALNIDMHLVDSPAELEAVLLPLCLLVTSFVKLNQLYKAAPSKALIDLDAGALITLAEICATSISAIRSSFVYSNWTATADQVDYYLRTIAPRLFLLYFLASPDAIEEDLASFGEITGLNAFLRGAPTIHATPIDTYFEPDRTILVEHLFLYDNIDTMFEAAATIYARGLINRQAMTTLSKIDDWINSLNFQPITLTVSHRSGHLLSILYEFWGSYGKGEFSDHAVASKLGPVMGGKGSSLTSLLQKVRTLIIAKEKVLEAYSSCSGILAESAEDSSLTQISSFECVSDDISVDEEVGHDNDLFAMQTLDRNKDMFAGSIVLASDLRTRDRSQSIAGGLGLAAKLPSQHDHLSNKEPLLGVPTIICCKRHVEYIREAIFAVAYILFNDYSPSTQTVARRLEAELILFHTLAMCVQRTMTLLPELLLLLPDLCDISLGSAHPRLQKAFSSSQDPLLEVISLLNIMRQLHSFCTESSEERVCCLSDEITSLKGLPVQPSLLLTTGASGLLRNIIRRCPYIIRSLSLHIAQADNILGIFSDTILRFPLIPSFTSNLSLEYACIPCIPATYHVQGQHYVSDLIRRCPLIRSAVLYNNICTSTSALLPSGKLRPIVFHTSNNAFSNSIYDIMTLRTGTGSSARLQITGLCAGYEQLRFLRPIDMPDTLPNFGTSIFAPSVHRAALVKEYLRGLRLLIEERYEELVDSCLYQCVHYALSTLVFMHLDGSPVNFLQLYYKCMPEFKRAVAAVAIGTATVLTDKSLNSCYSLRNYKHDRRTYIQALLARIAEHEQMLHTIMEDSLTLYIMRAIPNLSRAATAEKVASFISDEGQVRAAFIELYADAKSQVCITAMSCGVHPSAHMHHIVSTLPYGLPTESALFEASSSASCYGLAERFKEHTHHNQDGSSQGNDEMLLVSCANVAIPIIAQYTGKASLLDCIPLNYNQLQAVSQLGVSMQSRIPAFLVGDAMRSYNNIDYLIIVHSLCRYFGMRYEFVFCSPATDSDALAHRLCTRILAGRYVVLCGIEFLEGSQLNGLITVLSSYNLAKGVISTIEHVDTGPLNFSILCSTGKDAIFPGGYAICLPEAVYEGSKLSLTIRGERLRKLFPMHNLIEVKDYGTLVPASLIQQTNSLLYDLCLEARAPTNKVDVHSPKSKATEEQIANFFAEKNLSTEYHPSIFNEIPITALSFDTLYPHCNYNCQRDANQLGRLFLKKSPQYGLKLYEISLFLNTAGLSTPQLRLEDVDLVTKRCKDMNNSISVATALSAFLLSQTILRPARDIVSRVIEGAFALQPQHKAVLNSVVSLLNVLHGVQEPSDTDIGILISRKANYGTDSNFTANNIAKVWKTLRQMYTPTYAEFCETLSQKSALLEPVGIDALTLCLDMLSLGPVILLPPSANALRSTKGAGLTVSQLSNKTITAQLVRSKSLSNITLRQSHFQLLVMFSQLVAKIGKLRPFLIHSLADLHENIRTIMYLGSQALLIFIFNPPNSTLARSMLSSITALQSYYPELELYYNIRAKFDFFNKPRCLLLLTVYEDASIIGSNVGSVQRRLIVVPEYFKFSTMLNNYIGRHLHLAEDKQLTEKSRKLFTVISLIDMKTSALSVQYLQSLCSRRTTAELKGECLAEKRLRLGSKLFGVFITCLTDDMMRKEFNIVPSHIVWTLYRQLLVLFLTNFGVLTLSPCHPEAYATFEPIPEVMNTQLYQLDSYLSLHTITSSTPLAKYDSYMQLQSAPRTTFFNVSFSITYLQHFIYEASDNLSVIINLFLPIYAAVFNALHVLYIMCFKRPLNKLSKIYKKSLVTFVYRPEKFVAHVMSAFADSAQLLNHSDLDGAMALLPDLFPEHYADEDDNLSAYSYLGVSDSDGSFIYFLASDKSTKLCVRHFPYTYSSGIFADAPFERLFDQSTTPKHELVLTFDCERVLFIVYLSSFVMAKLSVCLIGEAFSGKSTYIRAVEMFLSNYVWREHVALFDIDSFDEVLQKLMSACYLHNIQTTRTQQTAMEPNVCQQDHSDATHCSLPSKREQAKASSVIGCPLSILDVTEDNTLLDETKDINQSIILDVPSSKLPLYHLTVTSLLTNTASHRVSGDALVARDATDELELSTLESLANSTSEPQVVVQNSRLSTLLGEKYIIMENSERPPVCGLTGIIGARFSSGIFVPNISIVVETSYLHDFLLTSEISFVLPPMNNTKEFLLLLLKRNFQHPSLSNLNSFAPKVVQAHTASTPQPRISAMYTRQKYDCNLYAGVKRPEEEFLHEYSDFYLMQFIEGLLLVEYHLPVSILKVIFEMKRLQKYIDSVDLDNIQMSAVTFGSLMGALRNIPAVKHSHMSRILDELASAVAIGRLAPHGPYGPLNSENTTKYLRTNALISMSSYSGTQTFPNWELRVLNAAFQQLFCNSEVSLFDTVKASADVTSAFADSQKTSSGSTIRGLHHSGNVGLLSDREKYKRLVEVCERARQHYAKLLFYNPHDNSVNRQVFEAHSSIMHEYLLEAMDPTICNRVFTLTIDISMLMEQNSLKVFYYIKYLRSPGLFSKLHSPADAKGMQTLALRVPVFMISQLEMSSTLYSSFLHVLQTMGNYRMSNRKMFLKVAQQAFSPNLEGFSIDTDSQANSFSCSRTITSLPQTISGRSLSEYDGPLLAHAVKNFDLRAFLSITEEPTEIAIKRRQRILIDTQTMIQSLMHQTIGASESESDPEPDPEPNTINASSPQSRPVTTTVAAENLMTELIDALVSTLSAQSEAVASYYIIRAAVLIALGINPLIAFQDFTPTSSTHLCDRYSSTVPDYLLHYINKGSLEINAEEYTDLFLSTPTDIMVTIPMSLFNSLLNKSPALGVLSMVESGSSLLSLFTNGEVRVLGALLAKYFCLTTMLSGKEIINILSRSFSLVVFADTSVDHPLPLQELPVIRHTIDESDRIHSLQLGTTENILQSSYKASETATPSLQLIRSIPYFILSNIPYNLDPKPFITQHEHSETPLHDAYSSMYCEVFCQTTLYIYRCCMQNVSRPIPYSLVRFSEIASYYTTKLITKHLKTIKLIQKILSSITLFDNGIRNGLFSPSIRNNIIYLRDQLVSIKLKVKLDFIRAVIMLQNACCDGPLIAARLLFYPFITSIWGNCVQFEIGLFECLKNKKITNTSLNTSYSDNSTVMLQSLFNLSTGDELIQRSDMLSNYGLPSRLLMLCEDLMWPRWKTQLICSLCNPDPKLIQEVIILLQYITFGFKFLFVTSDLARIIIPACEVYLLEARLEDCKQHLSTMGVNVEQTLEKYHSMGVMNVSIENVVLGTRGSHSDTTEKSDKNVARYNEIQRLITELEDLLKQIASLKYSAVSYKRLPSNMRFGAPSTCYNYHEVRRKLLIHLDCHLPPPIFEALLKHALLQDKPIVFLNFGSATVPMPNMMIMTKLALLIESRLTKKNAKVSVTTTYSVDIVRPLHDYRIYYVLATGASIAFLLETGFINLRNCDMSTLNAPKFQFKSNSLNLLKMQNPSVTEHELQYKLREISEKFSSVYSLYVNGFDGLEIVRRESCLECSDRLHKHIENIADNLEKHIFSKKEVMSRLIKREESNTVFVHLQHASRDSEGFDFSEMNLYCTGVERCIEYREEIAKKIAESSTISEYAKYFGTAITSILLLLRQMSLIHPSIATVFTDHFFECHLSYLDNHVESNPSRAFTVIVNTAHYILENTVLLLPERERGLYIALFMSIYNLCFKLGHPDDLTQLKMILVNDIGFLVSHFSDKFNSHLPLYNYARQIAANCPTSFRCSPNVVYSWKLFSLLSIYNPQRFSDWYEYFTHNKAVFTLLNFAGDAYKMIVGTYLYKERVAQSSDKAKQAELDIAEANKGTIVDAIDRVIDNDINLDATVAQEIEDGMRNLRTTHIPIVPPYVHDELATYSTRLVPLPPNLQYPSFENIWAALLLIVALRQDLILSTMEFFCRITPPSAIHKFLQDDASLRAKAKAEWCAANNEAELLSNGLLSQVANATAVAIDSVSSQAEGKEDQVRTAGDAGGPIDFSIINPANLDHVARLFKNLQEEYNVEATQQVSLGRGSRTVLLYYDEGLAILPYLQTIFSKEIVPKYGFPDYVCQPAPAASYLATNVVIVDIRYNPYYSLVHLIDLYNSGVKPAYLMYVLVPLSCCQKFGTESGVATPQSISIQLAIFIDICRPVQLYVQRPATFLDAMQHAISTMRNYISFHSAGCSVYESAFTKALTLLAIRYSTLVSNGVFKVDDNETLLLYIHLVSQVKMLPLANQGRRLFFAKRQGAAPHMANSPMMYSILYHTCSDINTNHILANLYSLVYRKSSAVLVGSPIKASANVAISYLNSKSLNIASFYEEVPANAHDQAEAERTDFDPSLSSIHNSDVEISNSKSVFSSAESSIDDVSMCSFKTDHTYTDQLQVDGAPQTTSARLMTLAGDELNTNVLLNATGPDGFRSYSRAELQRILSSRRHLVTIHASSRIDSLLCFPETMSEGALIDLIEKIKLITVDLEKFATKHTNVSEILRTQELQERLADTLQPICFLRPELSKCQSTVRDAFSLMLSTDVISNIASQPINSNAYSSVEVDRTEKALPPTLYAVLLLSKTYQKVRKLTYGFTSNSLMEQSYPIKVLSENMWSVRGDIYQPIMHDILKFFRLQMCLKYSMEMEYYSVVFTLLDPIYYKDWFLRYDGQNCIQCSRIDNKRQKRKHSMPLAAVRVTNMRLYGIGYDYILNTIVDVSPENLSYPNNCDIYAILIPCEIPSSLMLPDFVKTRDSYFMMYETLSYSSSPPQSEEELAEVDQNFGVDHYYENTIQHVTIPVDFPGCWDLILQNKTSLKKSDIDAKSPYCGTGYF